MVLLFSVTLSRALKKRFHSLSLGKYRILGRVVHLNYVKEQLEKKQGLNYDFSRARQEMRFISRVEIQTDSLYVEVSLKAEKKKKPVPRNYMYHALDQHELLVCELLLYPENYSVG